MQHVANFRIYYKFLLHDKLLVNRGSITGHMFLSIKSQQTISKMLGLGVLYNRFNQ